MLQKLRQPICVFLGHVDHGKSSVLERIRGKNITQKEAGGITQAISAYLISKERLNEISGDLLKKLKIDLKIPGILFIDSPGHASFTSLRKRGGNIADIAVLIIDLNDGLKPQTLECIEILKSYKTPFVIVVNKIDLIHGWNDHNGSISEIIEKQSDKVKYELEEKLYKIVGRLSELGLDADRFDRVEDYTKKIAIIPTSAKKEVGISELVMVIGGLTQKYLEKNLCINKEGKGVVLEVLDDKKIGKTAEIILYDGVIRCGDEVVIGSLDEIFVTKIRGLFKEGKSVRETCAADCIKLFCPGLEKTSPGMPLRVINNNLDEVKKEVKKEINYERIEIDEDGIVAKADSLGSLEALVHILKENNIRIRKVGVGEINKKDIVDAIDSNPLNSVILGFNLKNTESEEIKVITSDIIYEIIDIYSKWKEKKEKEIERENLNCLPTLFKIKVMRNYIFRQSNPAVVGVEVLLGKIKEDCNVLNLDSINISNIKSIQEDGKTVKEAEKGKQVAVAFTGITVGRQINEEDIFYSEISESQFRMFKDRKDLLESDEKIILKEISEIKRRKDSNWGF